jgi:glycosyltransferase involved in cell wall biosynthesis
MSDPDTCQLTAIVPAYRRPDQLLATLRQIRVCKPAPAEILVHVDGGDSVIVEAVKAIDPSIGMLVSDKLLGPGGSRNRLIAAASHELVANFDDDSFPEHPDYFARVIQGEEVAVLRGNTCQPLRSRLRWLNAKRGLGVLGLRLRIADVVGHRY